MAQDENDDSKSDNTTGGSGKVPAESTSSSGELDRKNYGETISFLIKLIAIAVFLYPTLFAIIWVRKLDADTRLEHERIELDSQRALLDAHWLERAAAQPPPSPTLPSLGQYDTPRSAQILSDFVDQRSPRQTSPVQPILGLIDALVGAGSIVAKDADELKREIQKAAIHGGEEITVETAKGLIKRFIEPHDEPKESPLASDMHSGGVTQINNSYCGAPEPAVKPPTIETRHPLPPKVSKPIEKCTPG